MLKEIDVEEEESRRHGDIYVGEKTGKLTGKMRIRLSQKVNLLTCCDELPWSGGLKIEGRNEEEQDREEKVYEAREVYKALTMTWLKVYENGKNIGWAMSWSLMNETADTVKAIRTTYATESALGNDGLPKEEKEEEETNKKSKTED